MARIRTVKPEIFKDENIGDISIEARWLFVGLWTLADREGRLEDRPKRIKVEIFPYDEVDVDALLNILTVHNFIIRYTIEGRGYIQIRTFQKHQRPHVREINSFIPPPPDDSTKALPRPCLGDAENAGLKGMDKQEWNIPHTPFLGGEREISESSQDGKLDEPCTAGTALSAAKTPGIQELRFQKFWEAYPLKRSKGRAERAWKKLKPSEQLLATMLAKIEIAKTSDDWTKEAGKFVPHPASWLNAKGWEDEYVKPNPQRVVPLYKPKPIRERSDADRAKGLEFIRENLRRIGGK